MQKGWKVGIGAVLLSLFLASMTAVPSYAGISQTEVEARRAKAAKFRDQRIALIRERRNLHEQMKSHPGNAAIRKEMIKNRNKLKALSQSQTAGKGGN